MIRLNRCFAVDSTGFYINSNPVARIIQKNIKVMGIPYIRIIHQVKSPFSIDGWVDTGNTRIVPPNFEMKATREQQKFP